MNPDPLGPKNLHLAFGKIKSAMDQKRAQRNGHGPRPGKEHNKFCPICSKTFHHEAILVDPEIKPMNCPECTKELDKGQIAIICPLDKRIAWVYSSQLVGQGPVIQVSKEVMDQVEAKAKAEQLPPTDQCPNASNN